MEIQKAEARPYEWEFVKYEDTADAQKLFEWLKANTAGSVNVNVPDDLWNETWRDSGVGIDSASGKIVLVRDNKKIIIEVGDLLFRESLGPMNRLAVRVLPQEEFDKFYRVSR